MQENKMTIIDDDGVEREVEIILTFDGTDNNHYVLFRDPQDPEGSVYPYQYDEESGEMNVVTDPEALEMCEEVLGAFMDEEEDDEKA